MRVHHNMITGTL